MGSSILFVFFCFTSCYSVMYVCINLFKVGQIYIYVNKKHLALQCNCNTNLNLLKTEFKEKEKYICIYINTYSKKLLNFYMHINIFKIIETCYYWLHIIKFHDAPFHFLINVLKALRFSAVLILKGRAFQILGP